MAFRTRTPLPSHINRSLYKRRYVFWTQVASRNHEACAEGMETNTTPGSNSSKPMLDIPFTCLDWLTWDWLFLDDGITEFQPKQKDKSALSIIETEKTSAKSSSSSDDSTSDSSSSENETPKNSTVFLLNNFNMLAHLWTKKNEEYGPACGASLGRPNRF